MTSDMPRSVDVSDMPRSVDVRLDDDGRGHVGLNPLLGYSNI